MKRSLSIFLVMLIIFTFYPVYASKEMEIELPVAQIIEIMEQNNINPESWSIFARESYDDISLKEINKRILSLQKNRSYAWAKVENQHISKVTGTFDNEKITYAYYKSNGKYKAYLLYEIKGKKWLHNNKEINKKIMSNFQDTPKIFSCVYGHTSDMMESVLYNRAVELLNQFSAEPIEFLKEEAIVSLSAYTKLWKNEVPTKNGNMNVQIALRQGWGQKTSVTIGTPIITNEY